MDEPEPAAAGGVAAAKKGKRRKKPLAGADNAPLRRRIALARGGATSRDAAHSEDWARSLIDACTFSPAGAPPAVALPTGHSAAPWLAGGASTVCARGEPVTQPTRAPRVGQVVDRHAAGGFRHHADFMDHCTEQPGSPPPRPPAPPEMLHAMPAMPALHGRRMHQQAAHAAAASSTCYAPSSLSSRRENRAPPSVPQRQDSSLWDKVNINTNGLLDDALDSV